MASHNSQKIGYSNFLTSTDDIKPKSQPRSKSRKKNKQQSASPSNGTSTTRPSYTIAVKDFTTLADLIAAWNKTPIKVPNTFRATLDRIIAVRKWFSGKLSGVSGTKSPTASASDKSHSYFIGVLEQVWDVLRPLMPPDSEGENELHSMADVATSFSL
ncbi:hypothetical protein GQ43DRAFT_494634 [Delitschia confertaspora ATCC 74209]|uniref:DUF6604 domain-containing protein n=1 Tax=Delitschia confertaspora ATCC 74209 TaxID=1513339 RepID=A0A9P4MVN8_9PLEO|nr:hypothetical protein GQ43DRAFT_494634 [Delitschia confertaspora ATCC 74209]